MEMLYTLKILPQELSKKQLFLNDYQLDMLDLTPEQKLTLYVGFNLVAVEVAKQIIHSAATTLYLSESAFLDLNYYQGEPLSLVFSANNKLVLGPTLGLTVTKNTFNNINKSETIKKRAYLALEKGILLSCFRLKNIDWEDNSVDAYCLNPISYTWVKKTIPVPQVLYDRGSYPGPNTVIGYKQYGKVNKIQWVNSTRTFGKLETFEALRVIKETAEYMPETTLLTLSNLEKFLEQYKYCFIKHNYGRNGRQVFRVEMTGKHYLCKTGGRVVKSCKFKKIESLYSFLRKTLGKDVILQQGIFLTKIADSPFDMRVLVQKNNDNEWIITAVNFRIAKPGAIVTNFAAGARDAFVNPGEALLHSGLSWKLLTDFTLKVAYAMETALGSLGEIGLDVALDLEGKLWLIEANSRPSGIAYRKAPVEACSQIFGLPLDYAIYLVRDMFNNF